jgi:hypothetical protein
VVGQVWPSTLTSLGKPPSAASHSVTVKGPAAGSRNATVPSQADAARRSGTRAASPFVPSTMSSHTLEDAADAGGDTSASAPPNVAEPSTPTAAASLGTLSGPHKPVTAATTASSAHAVEGVSVSCAARQPVLAATATSRSVRTAHPMVGGMKSTNRNAGLRRAAGFSQVRSNSALGWIEPPFVASSRHLPGICHLGWDSWD